MRSSTSITITVPLLPEEQYAEMLQVVCSVSDWLEPKYFQSFEYGDKMRFMTEESGIEYGDAEELIDVFIMDFAVKYLTDASFEVCVHYEQMNADGSTIWTAVYKNHQCTFTTDTEICCELVCPNCYEDFDVDIDIDDRDDEFEDEDYDIEPVPEYKLVCPKCKTEYYKVGRYLRHTYTDSLEV